MGVAGSRHPGKKHPAGPTRGGRLPRARSAAAGAAAEPMVFVIPSDPTATRDVQQQVVGRAQAMGYDEQDVFAIRLALEEGMMNAIKHGNKLDRSKTVRIEAKVTPATVEITVEDQGPGFQRTAVPDPCCEENLLKCSGRGILLMEAYMDKVQYSRGGRRVKMVKRKQR